MDPYVVQGGFFFLQRVNDSFLARLRFNATGIKHQSDTVELNDDIHTSGKALSAILLTDLKLAHGKQMPDIPNFDEIDDKDYEKETEFTISGYPD